MTIWTQPNFRLFWLGGRPREITLNFGPRRFNYQDKDLLNFSEWNQFEIWTKEIKKDEFRMIFKLNGNIVDPFSPNNTIVSKIIPKIYPEELFVYAGPGWPDVEFFPGKIRNLLISLGVQ